MLVAVVLRNFFSLGPRAAPGCLDHSCRHRCVLLPSASPCASAPSFRTLFLCGTFLLCSLSLPDVSQPSDSLSSGVCTRMKGDVTDVSDQRRSNLLSPPCGSSGNQFNWLITLWVTELRGLFQSTKIGLLSGTRHASWILLSPDYAAASLERAAGVGG